MGRIFQGFELTDDVSLTVDVCVVGSGAGGAVTAARLAEKGLSVVVLEEGGYHARRDFDLKEGSSYRRLYQDAGTRATSDLAITILQGRSLGGSTTINWTTCYRTPDRILARWRDTFGIDTLSAEVLAPHFEAVEARLNIHGWEEFAPNAHNEVIRRGCEALGWEYGVLRRNVKGCANSGYCGMGCPVDGKQAMHVTYLPDAARAGADLYADVRVERLEVSGGRVVKVHGVVLDRERRTPTGRTVVVTPRTTVLSGGAINSPALLLRSGLDDGVVGKRTFLHPVTALPGLYDQELRGWQGAPQSVASHQHIDRGPDKLGFFLEVPPLFPVLPAAAAPYWGADGTRFMGDLGRTGVLIALHVDGLDPEEPAGTVRYEGDRLRVDYPLGPLHAEGFRASHEAMATLHFAAGASKVISIHAEPLELTDPAQIPRLADKPYGAHEHPVLTAHQMGGCAMGPDPATAVVDPHLRHHRVENLFVVDGSVLPTALGVNPSETIYGIAHWAADHIATS